MRILLVGNGYIQHFKRVLHDTYPKAQVEETGDKDISFFASTRKDSSPDVIILGNRDLRFAKRFKEIYPYARVVLLLLGLEDEPEYRDAADKRGVDHVWIMSDLNVGAIRQTISHYA